MNNGRKWWEPSIRQAGDFGSNAATTYTFNAQMLASGRLIATDYRPLLDMPETYWNAASGMEKYACENEWIRFAFFEYEIAPYPSQEPHFVFKVTKYTPEQARRLYRTDSELRKIRENGLWSEMTAYVRDPYASDGIKKYFVRDMQSGAGGYERRMLLQESKDSFAAYRFVRDEMHVF